MADRELLELAAKAAGIKLIRWNEMLACFESDAGFFNPLHDDGDALRLAVLMGFRVIVDRDLARSHAHCEVTGRWVTSPHNDDPYVATRRSIVELAANIGRAIG